MWQTIMLASIAGSMRAMALWEQVLTVWLNATLGDYAEACRG
jgi:hypothetical protein